MPLRTSSPESDAGRTEGLRSGEVAASWATQPPALGCCCRSFGGETHSAGASAVARNPESQVGHRCLRRPASSLATVGCRLRWYRLGCIEFSCLPPEFTRLPHRAVADEVFCQSLKQNHFLLRLLLVALTLPQKRNYQTLLEWMNP